MLEWTRRYRYTQKGRMIHNVERFVPVAPSQVGHRAIDDV